MKRKSSIRESEILIKKIIHPVLLICFFGFCILSNSKAQLPVITSNGGGDTAYISINENTTSITTVIASGGTPPISYYKSGGNDNGVFTLISVTGVLTLSSSNYENPLDAPDQTNTYVVVVRAQDALSLIDTQTIIVTVTDINDAPNINSDGGGPTATINVNEGATAVTTVTATDEDADAMVTFSISGGEDADKFSIDPNTGALTIVAQDFEKQTDLFGNNTYKVRIYATDNGGLTDSQVITVNIVNVNESPDPPRNLYIISQNKSNILKWTASAGGGITEYHIYRSEDSVIFNPYYTVGGAITEYTDNNLINDKFYFYRIKAWNGSSESVFSNTDASTPDEDQISHYMHFDGNNDYLVVNDTNKLMAIDFFGATTLECWVRLPSLPASNAYIISKDYNGSLLTFYELYYDAASKKFIYKYRAGYPVVQTYTVISTTTVTANKWYHVAVTHTYKTPPYDAVRMYINGTYDAISANTPQGETFEGLMAGYTPFYPSDSRFVIGAKTSAISPFTYNNFFEGDISEIRIWNSKLNDATIDANKYLRGRGDETGLIGLWHLDTLFNKQVYNYDNLNLNAKANGNVCGVTVRTVAVNDTFSVQVSNIKYLNVKKNDTLETPTKNVLSKIINGPQNGTAFVINGDSIGYDPGCFVGTDTISYLICDTTFFGNPYRFADTAKVVITCYDNLKPTFTAMTDTMEHLDAGCDFTILDYRYRTTVSDNCPNDLVIVQKPPQGTIISTHNNDTTVWIIANDGHGNIDSVDFILMVTDSIKPVINCTVNKTVNADNGVCTYSHSGPGWDATATDNCEVVSLTYRLEDASTGTGMNLNGVIFNRGTTTVWWRASDVTGNEDSCSFTVIVSDNQDPSITAPADVTVNSDHGSHTASGIILGMPFTSDNCGVSSVINDAPAIFPAGNTAVTWTVNDMHGNTNTSTQIVTVIDNQPPLILNMQGQPVNSIYDTTLENNSIEICINTFDDDGDKVILTRFRSITGNSIIDTVPGQSYCFTITPDALFYGTERIEIIVSDGKPAGLDTAIIYLYVLHVNRAPVILDRNNNPADSLNFEAYTDEQAQFCLDVTDPDNDIVNINISPLDNSGLSELSIQNNACLNYLSAPGFTGAERYFIMACDNGDPSLCDSAVLIINVGPEFIISQAISPNDDGINDWLIIEGIDNFPDNLVTVFSRWGDIVYTTHKYDNVNTVWRGEFNGNKAATVNEAPDGTYFFIIELGNGQKLTGFVVLKR